MRVRVRVRVIRGSGAGCRLGMQTSPELGIHTHITTCPEPRRERRRSPRRRARTPRRALRLRHSRARQHQHPGRDPRLRPDRLQARAPRAGSGAHCRRLRPRQRPGRRVLLVGGTRRRQHDHGHRHGHVHLQPGARDRGSAHPALVWPRSAAGNFAPGHRAGGPGVHADAATHHQARLVHRRPAHDSHRRAQGIHGGAGGAAGTGWPGDSLGPASEPR